MEIKSFISQLLPQIISCWIQALCYFFFPVLGKCQNFYSKNIWLPPKSTSVPSSVFWTCCIQNAFKMSDLPLESGRWRRRRGWRGSGGRQGRAEEEQQKEEQQARGHVSAVSQPRVSSVACRSCLWWSAAPRGSPWATWSTRPNTACRRRSSSSARPRAAPAAQRNVSPRWGEAGTEAGGETPVHNITALLFFCFFCQWLWKENVFLCYKVTFADENLNIHHPSIHPLGRGTPQTRLRQTTKYSPNSCKMQI